MHRPDPAPSARWQRGEVTGALYLADSAETAWAEWYRALAERALPPTEPRDLWRVSVVATRVADLRTTDALAAFGLGQPRPDHREWPAYQEVGHDLHRQGYAGLIAPSAARPAGQVLCLFRDAAIEQISPIAPPETHRSPPAVPRGMTT